MMNLNSSIELDFKKFFRWWKRELEFLVPERLKQIVKPRQGVILIRPDGDLFDVCYVFAGIIEPLAKLERNEAGASRLQELRLRDERLAKAEVVFRLSKGFGLTRKIVLPPAAAENLEQVIAYELSRYTPFSADQAYFAVRRLGLDSESGQLQAQLILTGKKILDGFYEDLMSMGLLPAWVDYEEAPNDLDDPGDAYSLLPESLRSKSAHLSHLVYSSLYAALAVLCLAVIALPVWWEYQAVEALREKIVPLEKEAKKIKALQAENDSITEQARQLIQEKNSSPALIVVLNSLSDLIKEDTWLTYLQYSDGHLQLQGESPNASALISVLEASDLFVNARFVSPVTQDNVSKLERFQITVDTESPGAGRPLAAGPAFAEPDGT